jgi:hypothetical protein
MTGSGGKAASDSDHREKSVGFKVHGGLCSKVSLSKRRRTHGTGFIREGCVADDENTLNVPASSRINPVPRDRRHGTSHSKP